MIKKGRRQKTMEENVPLWSAKSPINAFKADFFSFWTTFSFFVPQFYFHPLVKLKYLNFKKKKKNS